MDHTAYIIITGVCTLALLGLLVRFHLQARGMNLSLWSGWAVILMSLLCLATSVRIVPGGPFVSIHADIFPAISCIVVLVACTRVFQASSIGRKIGLLFTGLGSVGVISLVVMDIVAFCQNRFARGVVVGW